MAKNPIFQMRVAAETRGRWDVAAKRAGKSLAGWITEVCDAAVPKTPVSYIDPPVDAKGSAVIFETTQEQVDAPAARGLKRAPSAKKQKRAAEAKTTRESVAVTQSKGEMFDVHMPAPDLISACKHHKRFGELCYKCDPKFGVPEMQT